MSQFTPEERDEIFARVAAALEPTAGERQDKHAGHDGSRQVSGADVEPRWPRPRHYTDLRPAVSLEMTDRWMLEQRELADRREQARLERKRQERELIEQRRDADLKEWMRAHVKDALEAHTFNDVQRDALGHFVAEFVGNAIAEIRAEFISSARSVRDVSPTEIVTLPNWRRHDAA